MIKTITSVKNQFIKNVVLLQSKSRERKKQNLIVIEGLKECSLAIKSKVRVKYVIFCPHIISYDHVQSYFDGVEDNNIYEVSLEVFSKISYRESTGGLILLAEPPKLDINDLSVKDESVFVVLESVEKPGNLGAIARVADGAGVDGIIICDPLTDVYNPNAIRASLGCVFTKDIVVSDFEEVQAWLKEKKIRSLAAELTSSEFYHEADMSGRIAIVFGTEAYGLTDKWIKESDIRVKIPMAGHIDSLNVSTSVAVLVYEAKRQRKFLV